MPKVCDMDCLNCKFPDCIKDDVAPLRRYSQRSEKSKQKIREYQKRLRAEAKANGLCTTCRKNKATHGTKCFECYLMHKRHNARRSGKRDFWLSDGKCYKCGREPIEGKKVCEMHYPQLKDLADRLHELPQTKEAQRKFTQWYWKLRGEK